MITGRAESKTARLDAIRDLLVARSVRAVFTAVEAYVSAAFRPDSTWVLPLDGDRSIDDPGNLAPPVSDSMLDHLERMDTVSVIEDATDFRSVAGAVQAGRTGLPAYRSFAFVPVGDHGWVIATADEPHAFDAAAVRSLRPVAELGEAILIELEEGSRRPESDADRRLDRIRRTLAHDLIQPITIARGNLELALERDEVSRLETVDAALTRLTQLTRELEAVATTGRRTREMEPVDVASIARLAWELCEQPGTSLEIETDRTVEADGNALCHVFENLFRNAIEHGARVVRVGAAGDVVYVEDDGPGIPPERREAVFERGYSTKDGHTGEGLSIVREIVRSHGWRIAVTEGDAGGTRFEIAV